MTEVDLNGWIGLQRQPGRRSRGGVAVGAEGRGELRLPASFQPSHRQPSPPLSALSLTLHSSPSFHPASPSLDSGTSSRLVVGASTMPTSSARRTSSLPQSSLPARSAAARSSIRGPSGREVHDLRAQELISQHGTSNPQGVPGRRAGGPVRLLPLQPGPRSAHDEP